MIKFSEELNLMKKLFKTIKKKWAEYLIEIVVISVGILLAFALNNWNEGRKQENQLNQYRNHLKIELAADIETLEHSERNIERFKKTIINYLDYYNSDKRNIDILVSKMDSIDYGLNAFNTAVYTIEELIFSGFLSSFPEKEKSAILKLRNTHENSEYYEQEQIRQVFSMTYTNELDLLYAMGYAVKEHSSVGGWKYDMNSSRFLLKNNHFAAILGFLDFQASLHHRIKDDTQALLDLLE